ncbi:MAG: HEAT repeat domain-containing protein [Acidobacteriota bacterium]
MQRPARSPILPLALLASLCIVTPSRATDSQALKKFRKMLIKGANELVFDPVETLEQLGLEPAEVVPVVGEVLNDSQARDTARRAAADIAVKLGEMGAGTPLVPALAQAIHDDNGFVSGAALRALQRIGKDAAPALPELMKLMRRGGALRPIQCGGNDAPRASEPAQSTRPAPRPTLSPIQSIGDAAVPFLLEGLASDLPEVRAVSADALHNHGRRAEIHRPLMAIFNDPVKEVRWQALETARYLQPSSPELLEALVARLADPDSCVVLAAVRALERPDAGAQAEALRPLLQHGNGEIRAAAARTLRRMEAGGTPLLETSKIDMANNLADPDPQTRFEAAVALAASAPDTPGLAEALRDGLRDATAILSTSKNLIDAIAALGQIGPRGRVAAPDLIQLIPLYHQAELVQSRAAQSLGSMGPMPEHVAAVAGLLPGAGDHLEVWLLYAITALDPTRDDGVAGLMERLESNDSVVQQNAVHALGLLGPRAWVALPELRGLLSSQDRTLQGLTEWAIGQIDTREV